VKLSKVSLALLGIQLAIVSTIAAKYLYQRISCPRVWTRTVAYDPDLLMRGRYLSVQLLVDGCQSTLPSAAQAAMPRDKNGVQTGKVFTVNANGPVRFPARIKVESNKLVVIRLPESASQSGAQMVAAWPGSSCDKLRLEDPVDFYIAEHAASPMAPRARSNWRLKTTASGSRSICIRVAAAQSRRAGVRLSLLSRIQADQPFRQRHLHALRFKVDPAQVALRKGNQDLAL